MTRWRNVLLATAVVVGMTGCASYSEPDDDDGRIAHPTVTGSRDVRDPARPILVWVMRIDGEAVAQPKRARCQYDAERALRAGRRKVLYGYLLGPAFIGGRVGTIELAFDAKEGEHYIARGSFAAPDQATIRVDATNASQAVVAPTPVAISEGSGKNFAPPGMALLQETCAFF